MSEQHFASDVMQPRNWYVRRKGQLLGPFSEAEVRQLVMAPAIEEDMVLRQGDSPFYSASKIRELFFTLEAHGYFVRDGGIVYGPYVGNKLLALVGSGFFSSEKILVREGTSGSWVTFKELKRTKRRQYRESHQASQVTSKFVASVGSAIDGSNIDRSEPKSGAPELVSQELDVAAGKANGALDGIVIKRDEIAARVPSLLVSPLNPATHFPSGLPADQGLESEQIGSPDEQQEAGDGRPDTVPDAYAPSTPKTCPNCGGSPVGKEGFCPRCHVKSTKRVAKTARQSKRLRISLDESVENYVGKLFVLAMAFGTSGFFLCKCLVSVGIWRDFHTRDQQMLGWGCLVVGLILTLVGSMVIYSDQYRKNDRKMIATGTLSLLLVGVVYYVGKTSQMRASAEEAQKQNMIWVGMMQQGGYLDNDE